MVENVEIGVGSFATMFNSSGTESINSNEAMPLLLERIKYADDVGVDVFGIGEHHRV